MSQSVKQWRTTAVGWLTGIGILITQVVAVIDSDPETTFSVEGILAGLAALGIGTLAKDGDK